MQDEKNNQPVILNLTPVNDSISQFLQLQTGILSEQEMFVPSDSILPTGTRIKVEYRLKSFGQKENVKIIDAVCEVIGPEVDSEKGRRGVRAKFLKLSPTSQVLIQKLLEKIKASKFPSGEKKIPEQKVEPPKKEEPKVEVTEPKVEITEPKVEIAEPKVQVAESTEKPVVQEQAIPSFSEVMAKIEQEQKKDEPRDKVGSSPSSLDEIMAKEIEKPKSGEVKTVDDKQAQYVFEYLPPGQPIEENTGIVKLREIVRSTDISSVKKTSKIWIVIIVILILLAGIIGFFFAFPQYAPKLFVKSHEVSTVITKRDLTPEVQPQPTPTPQPAPTPTNIKAEEQKPEQANNETQKAETKEEKKPKEEKKEEKATAEQVQEPEIQPLAVKEEKNEAAVKIITGSKIKKEREKQKKVQEENEKKVELEKEEKAIAKEKAAAEKEKAKKEAQSAEPGKIIIQVTPTDADLTVFIDGAQAGTMPTITKQLPSGSHTIKVVADGYNDEVRKVDLSEGETKTVKINLKEK